LISSAGAALAVDGVKLIGQPRSFPIAIDSPGTYRLKKNIVVPDADTTAIVITADDVTLDLNGFTISGPTTCTGGPPVTDCSPTGIGLGISSSNEGITVMNGTVRGMGTFGVSLGARAHVENVQAVSNGCAGIQITDHGKVNGCNASFNGRNGIISHFGNMVSGNTTVGTGVIGSPNCTYAGFSGTGIEGWADSILTGNISRQNSDSGLVCGNGGGDCTMTNNVASNNQNYGLVGCCSVSPFYYANNVLNGNNGMLAGLQVDSQGLQMGTNICGGDTTCP
jgi:hypothetical protein